MAQGTDAKYEACLKKRKLENEISSEEESMDDGASASTSDQIHKTKYPRLMMPNDFDPDAGPIDRGNRKDMEDAIQHGDLSAVKFYYLQNPYIIHQSLSDGLTPLNLATKLEYEFDIVKFLVLKGADVNAMGNQDVLSPLITASMIGNLNYVEFLLNYGANINFQNSYGCSALHTATLYEHFDIMEFLIERGADCSLRDYNRKTALHYGLRIRIEVVQEHLKKKKFDIMEFLIKRSTDRSLSDYKKQNNIVN